MPDLRGLKNEVIVKRSHRNGYDHGVRNAGVRFVEVDTTDELERAINDDTVMMFFVAIFEMRSDDADGIGVEEFAALGRKHGVPYDDRRIEHSTPMERLSEYLDAGFDLACFSGGKGLRGPYSAGMLLGREDLIAAARLNATRTPTRSAAA